MHMGEIDEVLTQIFHKLYSKVIVTFKGMWGSYVITY